VLELQRLDDAALAARFAELLDDARRLLAEEGVPPEALSVEAGCELRYVGQAYTLFVPLDSFDPAAGLAAGGLSRLAAGFHQQHERLYGHSERQAAVEIVNLRLRAFGPAVEPPLAPPADGSPAVANQPTSCRVYFAGRWHEAAVYRREALRRGAELSGPAIVEEMGSTTCLWPGDRAEVDAWGSLRLTVG
jgi:N-methylhydantoinase A